MLPFSEGDWIPREQQQAPENRPKLPQKEGLIFQASVLQVLCLFVSGSIYRYLQFLVDAFFPEIFIQNALSLRIQVCPKEGINPNQSYSGDGMFRPSILRIFGRGLDS